MQRTSTSGAVTTLRDFGLLGTDVNYAHGNMLTDEEFDLIAASGGSLSISPSSDMLMQFGTYPGTGRALQRGIVSGFGVDTICSVGNGPVLRAAARPGGRAIPGERRRPRPRRTGTHRRPAPTGHAAPGYPGRRESVESRGRAG
jgi:hypothetical protein